jgi:hypothetical protein
MEFESTIPAFEREKTIHALDSAATVIGADSVRVPLFKEAFSALSHD